MAGGRMTIAAGITGGRSMIEVVAGIRIPAALVIIATATAAPAPPRHVTVSVFRVF